MAFISALIKGLTESKPGVPDFYPINYDTILGSNLQGNINLLPQAEKLGTSVNTYNQGELERMLKEAAPWADEVINKGARNISDWESGIIPTDVQDAIKRGTAFQSLSGGYGGSPMAGNLTARDLGLTSLDLQGKGTAAALPFLSGVAGLKLPQRFDVTSQFGNVGQRLGVEQYNREGQFNRDWLRNKIESMPESWQTELSDTLGQIEEQIGSMALGGIMGGGGGGGGGIMSMLGGMGGGGGGNSRMQEYARFGGGY